MIGIIGAMQTEVEFLISEIKDARCESISGIDFYSGKLCGKDVVVARCGIGKVFAAMCAQTMIVKYGVERLINTGVGGAISNELNITDIAISNFVVQHDMDTSALGDPVGLISGINIIEIPASKKLCETVCRAAEKLSIKAKSGIIASGDCFVSSAEKKRYISDNFSAIACEMEGASIAQVCYVNGVDFVIIRAISDSADGSAEMDYGEFSKIAADKSAKVVKAVLEKI